MTAPRALVLTSPPPSSRFATYVDRALEQPALGPLLTSAFAVALLVARVWHTGRPTYLFLGWNLMLAWLPYLLSSFVDALDARAPAGREAFVRPRPSGRVLFAVGVPWLLLLPNAPYLVTDLIHLKWSHTAPLWFDAALFGSFACCGVLLGVRSLESAERALRERWGALAAWMTMLGVLSLTGFGIYLGRFVRLNSWDALTNPAVVMRAVFTCLHNEPFRVAGVSAVFAALTAVTFIALRRPTARRTAEAPSSDRIA